MIIMAKKRFFAWSPLRKLMADSGAKLVSRDAVSFLLTHLQDEAVNITKRAFILAKHSNRKKVTQGDIELAVKGF